MERDIASRERRVMVALGAQGVGKTALARKLVDSYDAGPVRILDPSGNWGERGEWPGRRETDAWIDELTAEGGGPGKGGWGPGLLVLDDADRYLLAQSHDSFRDVWLANRHLGLDVLVTAHRAPSIPKDLLGAADELWLFRQAEVRALDYLSKIPALEFLLEEGYELPREKGLALRVMVHEHTGELVKIF